MSDVGLSPEARERSKLYDASAKVYAAYFPLVWRFLFPKLHGWLAKQFADRGHILDAGTGPGYWVDYLARTEPRERVVGLDFSEESIKSHVGGLTRLHGSLLLMDIEVNSLSTEQPLKQPL